MDLVVRPAVRDNDGMRAFAMLLVLVAGACSSHRYFMPRENNNGTGPGWYPAAVYPVAAGAAAGEVRVWSRGCYYGEADDAEAVELHLGFEIENTGSVPLAVDAGSVRCEDLSIGAQRLAGGAPARRQGDTEAGPGATARFDLFFRLDEARAPRDVSGFSVRFQVLAASQPVLAQVTPFVPYIASYYGCRDPWFWGPGYWGGGFALGYYGWYGCH